MLWICNYVPITECDNLKKQNKTKDVCFPTGLYSMTEEQNQTI